MKLPEPEGGGVERQGELVSAILNVVGALVVVLDREARIVQFNRACEQATGYRVDEVRGRVFWDFLLTAEEKEPVQGVFAELRAGHFPNSYENDWVARDGTRRRIAWSNTALLDAGGAVEHIIASGIDITERRRAERRQEAEYLVTKILAEAETIEMAAPCLLRAICQHVDWAVGELWLRDRVSGTLRCLDT